MTKFMKQRVVITGAAGFIGSHLAETLLDRDYTVVGIDNLLTGDTANISHLSNRDFTRLGPLAARYAERDLGPIIGRDHSLTGAVASPRVAAWVAPYTWAAP